jgi:tetratricopeptide (TPR) repeat protein
VLCYSFHRLGILFADLPKPFKTQDDMHDNDLKEKAAFLSTAQAFLDQALYKEASDHAELWLREHPMDADANIVYCHALMKTGKLNRVEEVLEGVEDTILHLSRVYAFMGDICLESGLTREAIRFYRKFISINPDTADAGKLSDKLRMFTSTPDESAEEMESDQDERIDQVAPDFYTVTLAELYIRQGYLQMAADVLGEILRNDSENHAAADKFNEVKVMLKDKKHKEDVVGELTQWLNNMDRIRSHAS